MFKDVTNQLTQVYTYSKKSHFIEVSDKKKKPHFTEKPFNRNFVISMKKYEEKNLKLGEKKTEVPVQTSSWMTRA